MMREVAARCQRAANRRIISYNFPASLVSSACRLMLPRVSDDPLEHKKAIDPPASSPPKRTTPPSSNPRSTRCLTTVFPPHHTLSERLRALPAKQNVNEQAPLPFLPRFPSQYPYRIFHGLNAASFATPPLGFQTIPTIIHSQLTHTYGQISILVDRRLTLPMLSTYISAFSLFIAKPDVDGGPLPGSVCLEKRKSSCSFLWLKFDDRRPSNSVRWVVRGQQVSSW